MVKYTPAALISLLMPSETGLQEIEKRLQILLSLGFISKAKGGKYEVTATGLKFVKEWDAAMARKESKPFAQPYPADTAEFSKRIEDRKLSIERYRTEALREKYGKTSKTAVKYELKDVIKLADRVARESRHIEKTLRKTSR